MRWVRHPVGFALFAALVVVAVAAVSRPVWQRGALLELGDGDLGEEWRRDVASGSAHLTSAFPAAAAAGVSAAIVPREGGEVVLAVQWRRRGEDVWYLRAQPHNVGRSRVYFALAEDPDWSGEIVELAVSTLHDLPLRFEALRVEGTGPLAALPRLWFVFAATETYRQSSLNWLDGMRVGDADLAWWLAGAWLAGAALLAVSLRRRSTDSAWRAVAALALLLWVVADLRFTANLLAAWQVDRASFPAPLTAASADAVVASADPSYRQLVAQVRAAVPSDARLGFVSADPSLLIRARYVFYPRQVVHPPRRWVAIRPDYVAVFLDDQVRYRAGEGVLSWGRFGRLPARPVAQLAEGVGLYRVGRARPAPRSRP